eukprot:GDKJ01036556.1.p1 GENE.GDKJ01036556.1~~GDKJ01036556.1.p1  ORF type:complete len:323 (+),score=30.82 GDKJ01036556.1:45-1013(+)
MDYVLDLIDPVLLDFIYPSWMSSTNPIRQFLTLVVFISIGGAFVYLLPATLLFNYGFDKRLMLHKKFIPNQHWLEIKYALWSVPWMAIPTAIMFVLEIQGYSKLYDRVDEHPWGWGYIFFSIIWFLLFTDFGIYWIHRWLHLPFFYHRFHKPHHRWLVCTPFASHAFHPVDGFSQSFPYHLFPFLFPLHKVLYLCLFCFVNTWSTLIHDGIYIVPNCLKSIVNGSAHHTDHHLFFKFNYGQYLTLWDRLGGSFKEPSGFAPGQSIYDDLVRQGIPHEKSTLNHHAKIGESKNHVCDAGLTDIRTQKENSMRSEVLSEKESEM